MKDKFEEDVPLNRPLSEKIEETLRTLKGSNVENQETTNQTVSDSLLQGTGTLLDSGLREKIKGTKERLTGFLEKVKADPNLYMQNEMPENIPEPEELPDVDFSQTLDKDDLAILSFLKESKSERNENDHLRNELKSENNADEDLINELKSKVDGGIDFSKSDETILPKGIKNGRPKSPGKR